MSANIFDFPELKGYLAAVDFEARDGLSVDQFITVSLALKLPVFFRFLTSFLKQIVKSAQSAREDAADESDVLEAWISLGVSSLFAVVNWFLFHIFPGGSPDKSGMIKASKLSGVFSEFELAVDLSKSVSTLPRTDLPLSLPTHFADGICCRR